MFISNFIDAFSVYIANNISNGKIKSEKIQQAVYAGLMLAVPALSIWLSYSLIALTANLIWLNLAIKFGDQFLKQLSLSIENQSKINAPFYSKLYNIFIELLQNAAVPTILLISYLAGISLVILVALSILVCGYLNIFKHRFNINHNKIASEIIAAINDIVVNLLLNLSNIFVMVLPRFKNKADTFAGFLTRYSQWSKNIFDSLTSFDQTSTPNATAASNQDTAVTPTAPALESGVKSIVGFLLRSLSSASATNTATEKQAKTKPQRS